MRIFRVKPGDATMSAMKKRSNTQTLAAAFAAVLGLAAAPAQANLVWELTIGGVGIFSVAGKTINDNNSALHMIAREPPPVKADLIPKSIEEPNLSTRAKSHF